MKLFSSILILFLVTSCGGGGGGSSTSNPPPAEPKWLVDTDFVRDGGPGKDGIPSIDNPRFSSIQDANFLTDNDRIIGTRINGVARAFPHSIMNWHEIVNVETTGDFHALVYCPLTGTASLWNVPTNFTNKTFGVSGLLYNSNIILYDRETDSNWVQMLAQSVNGQLIGDTIETNSVIETSWGVWKQMYPDTTVLSDVTGFSRNYDDYPYGSYLSDDNLLFNVANSDGRLHKKARVLGVNGQSVNTVYEIENFSPGIDVINETDGTAPYVVIGSSQLDFAVAYSATTTDGTDLTFVPVQGSLPVIMEDNEGNQWDVLGVAVTGTRAGQKLTLKSDFIAFWFAWVAIHPNPTIHSF